MTGTGHICMRPTEHVQVQGSRDECNKEALELGENKEALELGELCSSAVSDTCYLVAWHQPSSIQAVPAKRCKTCNKWQTNLSQR